LDQENNPNRSRGDNPNHLLAVAVWLLVGLADSVPVLVVPATEALQLVDNPVHPEYQSLVVPKSERLVYPVGLGQVEVVRSRLVDQHPHTTQ